LRHPILVCVCTILHVAVWTTARPGPASEGEARDATAWTNRVREYLSTPDAGRAQAILAEIQRAAPPWAAMEESIRAAGGSAADRPGRTSFEAALPDGQTKTVVHVLLPPGYSPVRAWPAIFALHPTGGTGRNEIDRWAAHLRPGEREFVVIAPDAHGALRGQGWGSTEPERALTIAALTDAVRQYRIYPDRVFLAGCSRGAHGTWEIGLLYPDRFAALYSNAGGPRVSLFGYLDNPGAVPILAALGAQDQTLLVDNVRAAVAHLRTAGTPVTYREYPDRGHGVGFEDDATFTAWVAEKRRDMYPKRIAHAFSQLQQGRAWWVEAVKLSGSVLNPLTERPAINVPSGSKLSESELRERYKRQIEEGVARIDASVQGKTIDIRARKVSELVVYLSDRVIPLDEPIEIRLNGKSAFRDKVTRDVSKLLQHVRETGDRGRLFANWVRLAVK
jgi:predicted esterase